MLASTSPPLRSTVSKLVLTAAVLTLLGLALAMPATSYGEVYWRDFERSAAVEPGRIDMYFGAGSYTYATGLRDDWHHWGGRSSWARGRIWVNNCRPSCARGDHRPHRGSVRLYRIHRCGGNRFYGRIKFRFDNRPDFWLRVDCRGYGVGGR